MPQPFGLQDVRLLPGPFHQAQQAHGVRLLAVQPDALLHPWRARAGLARRSALPHGGAWDLGPYLSACAAMWAATANPAFRQRVAHLSGVLLQCGPVPDDGERRALVTGLHDVVRHAAVPAAQALFEQWAAAAPPDQAAPGGDTDDPARYGELVYRHDEEALYVDRYIASVLHWPALGLRLRQLANCPEQGTARILLQAADQSRLVVRLRQPGWCPRAVVSVNGRTCAEGRQPGAFIEIHRPWRRGDEIAVQLPLRAPRSPLAPRRRVLSLLPE